ncbi:Hsp20/alpha crystallin family protein [Streptomyces orinoci]|uniref:Hsp20/alpha crystallin family protein n=1 Tax=Streptomyces orinoci TaxID=67339 RepID=A0ABV3K327_STRON|nr:Hsp20/alpha crystallin family protein [Streptomyces orinoci]
MAETSPARRRSGLPELMEWLGSGFPDWPGAWGARESHVIPIEVTDDGERYVLRAELPGMDPEKDIEITVEGDTLTVRAEHTETKEDKRHSEFRYGSFQRSVRLPFPIPEDGPAAEYRDGILTVTVPRAAREERATRTVQVRRAG